MDMAMAHHLTQSFLFAVLLISATVAVAGAAKVHHVVGGDPRWDSSSNLSTWSSTRTFSVGDQIWISYSAAEGVIAEVKSKEEYESCDAGNPIKMYTEGLHAISLEEEGIRYFLSTEPDSCNNGLKLHVDVQPMKMSSSSAKVEAEGPPPPRSPPARPPPPPSPRAPPPTPPSRAPPPPRAPPPTPSASPPYNRATSFFILILMFCVSIMFL